MKAEFPNWLLNLHRHSNSLVRCQLVKMASLGDADEESLYELQRPSLLDAVEDKNRAMSKGIMVKKKALFHRMVIISKLGHSNFTEIGQHYEKLFKDVTAHHQTEGITGLLLLYAKLCVHVIESSQDVLNDIVRDLRQDEAGNGNGHMAKSKIVITSQDIPSRLYQQWSYRSLDIEAPTVDDYDQSDEPESLVQDILLQILKLGSFISKQPKVTLKNTMENLHDKVPELLPQQDAIGFLVEIDNQVTSSPADYLNIYEKPYDARLLSEKVWPMPIKLFPYN